MSEHEVFRAKYEVTEWRDGAVFETRHVANDWFDLDEVQHPDTYNTNILYSNPTEPPPGSLNRSGIRRKKVQ